MADQDIGLKAFLMQARGDWQWFNQVFNFPAWNSVFMCWRCLANSTDVPWSDFGGNAEWRRHRCTAG
eukprot:8747098-Alexandrium_andersonii.AAC.1